ncbi:phosphotriesterase-related protein [Stylonychia lemnae]|uniref:Phosphotriesterase-related protein n=1 Tax=Stylonychia lemnae TaxID=5949 RepID=A0A078ADQ4_STYLE|nr:phosphotriesterase-related protein [Stylonychia lemnae]|eukprot:CDW79662.1 phosphotriesterase-related protein [Stylonychia lemnae]
METLYKDHQVSKGFLVGEYITQDLTKYCKNKNAEQITLQNLRRIQKNPYSNMQNLVISDQMERLVHDLKHISDKIGYILDLSTRFNGLDLDKIKRVEEQTQNNIKVLFGYTPSSNYLGRLLSIDNIQDQMKHDIEFEMKTGRKNMLPSFIGELIITDPNDYYQKHMLDACQNYQLIHEGCPIFLNLGSNSSQIPSLVDRFAATKGRSIVYMIQNPMNENLEVHPSIHYILNNSESYLCLTLYNHNLASYDEGDLDQSCEKYKQSVFVLRKFISMMIDNGQQHRLLVSNGIQHKTHLSFYGGRGYTALFDKLLKGLPQGIIDQLLIQNPSSLLLWREQQLEEPQAPTPKWDCRECKGRFEESHQKFEKMDNNYCSMKCLAAHRSKGFA